MGLLIQRADVVGALAASLYPVSATRSYDPLLASLAPDADRVAFGRGIPLELQFAPGQTVSDVLTSLSLGDGEARLVIDELAKHANLRRIRPCDSYAAVFDENSRLDSFELTLDGQGRAAVVRLDEGWRGSWSPFVREVTVHRLSGQLESSLEAAIRRAGGESAVAYAMADVLQWDLDFTRDLRKGDRFEILYESILLDGAYHSLGEVIALSYENQGRKLEAYRYGDGDRHGYYDAEGRPLRKMFLRSPMKYSRITSSFSGRRFHPILKSYRPHYGVDYGAPTGTPVRVTANGVVVSAGWSGGGGRTIKVRHPNGYVTAYLHLSGYGKSIRAGRRVQQGEVIGYVGSSGLATGPHLDYRVQLNDRWIDPLSLKSVPDDPVRPDDMPLFVAERDRLRRTLWDARPFEQVTPRPDARFTLAAVAPGALSGR
jgi:murein DD-endopeptidase MepM/ murein hydrolase activator NlpD